jgi:hypothetical protein
MRPFFWACAGVLGAAAVAISHPAFAKSKFEGGTGSVACGDGQIVYSPIQLWPPNHKMRTIQLTYIDSSDPDATQGDGDGDAESLMVNSIDSNQTSDEDEGGNGCGKKSEKQGPDWEGIGNNASGTDPSPIGTTVQLRGERCKKNHNPPGRVYTINVTCGDPDAGENPTTVDLTVTVPHDRRHAQKVHDQGEESRQPGSEDESPESE